MTFTEQLNAVITTIGCTSKQLSEASHLGTGTISRYRSGERIPSPDSAQFSKLINGLALLSASTEEVFSEEALADLFETSIRSAKPQTQTIDYHIYLQSLNKLLKSLDIKSVDLARYLHSDPSWISRILSGQRQPSDLQKFTADIAGYIASRFRDSSVLPRLLNLIGASSASSGPEVSEQELQNRIIHWLGSEMHHPSGDPIHSFFEKLNDFDLNQYMRQIHFQELKITGQSLPLPTTRNYYGIEQMKQAELDFMRATITSEAMDDVILYSDMPMLEMAKDDDFKKKWLLGIAMMLRRGLHLHIVHNIHRPFSEMLIGLETWVPMYMTGQISSYYFKEPTSQTFLHVIRSSGSAALQGDAIAGSMNHGRYTFSRTKEAIQYIRTQAMDMLSVAKPLMHIYKQDDVVAFHTCMNKLSRPNDVYRVFGSAPPLFAMSEDLLKQVLVRNQVSEEIFSRILGYRETLLKRYWSDEKNCTWRFTLTSLSDEELCSHPVRLPLSELCIDQDICYSPEEYKRHLTEAKMFAEKHKQFSMHFDPDFMFRNIVILVCEDRFVLVSKNQAPAIHFIVYHKKMIAALEDFHG